MIAISLLLTNLLTRLPMLFVLLFGVIFAIIRWKKHPAVSIIVCVLFGIELLLLTPLQFLNVYLPVFMRNEIGMANLSLISGILSWTGVAINGIAWVLVLVAIFGWRSASSNTILENKTGEKRG